MTHYLKTAFPKAKVLYTSAPVNDFQAGTQYLNLKYKPKSKPIKMIDMIRATRNASRHIEVSQVIRKRSIAMAAEALKARPIKLDNCTGLVVLDGTAKKAMFHEMLIDMFHTRTKEFRKLAWDNIKWRANLFGYKLDLAEVKHMWKKFKKEAA
jgi:hypothetical protein